LANGLGGSVEKSCGAIVFNNDRVLLVKHRGGHYGFPKGHMEKNETEIETAIREVKEETNIDIIIDKDKRIVTSYMMPNGILKEVVYFIAKNKNEETISQEGEIKEVIWIDYTRVKEFIPFDNMHELLKEVDRMKK